MFINEIEGIGELIISLGVVRENVYLRLFCLIAIKVGGVARLEEYLVCNEKVKGSNRFTLNNHLSI